MSTLSGKVAIITGSGRGIGRTTAQLLAQKGMLVAVNDINAEAAQQVADEICISGGKAIPLVGSVSSSIEVDQMFSCVEKELGPLWLLVNNAGIINAAPTPEMTEAMWDEAFAVDTKGVFLCSQAAVRLMIPRHTGRIVNFSSIAGLIVRTGQIAYCSAKAAVVHFTRCLAVEMAPFGITVNCVCPGMTRTDMLQETVQKRGLDMEAMIALIPAGHMAQETDHATLVEYFASAESSHTTGQVVTVDGAQSLYHPLTL